MIGFKGARVKPLGALSDGFAAFAAIDAWLSAASNAAAFTRHNLNKCVWRLARADVI